MTGAVEKLQLRSLRCAARVAVAVVGVTWGAAACLADGKVNIPAADLERLLSTVKAQHPEASVLKVEREPAEGRRGDLYEVKLLRPDGQVLKLYFDATSLAPVLTHDEDDDGAEQHRRRERRRGHW